MDSRGEGSTNSELLNFFQMADDVLVRFWPREEAARPSREYVCRRIRDLVCVLVCGKTFMELINQGDKGFIKIAGIFPDCLQLDIFRMRYRLAQEMGDKDFVSKFNKAIKKRRNDIDARFLHEPGWSVKVFLFLNWERPITRLSLSSGLSALTDEKILDLLRSPGGALNDEDEGVDAALDDKWDAAKIKEERKRLGLRKRPESLPG